MAAYIASVSLSLYTCFMTDGNALDKLNDGQRDCLRLVYAHMSSKEIAAELGISPHTVDQRLRAAMRILDCDSRFAAARMLATQEKIGRAHV